MEAPCIKVQEIFHAKKMSIMVIRFGQAFGLTSMRSGQAFGLTYYAIRSGLS
jgi:hypothetical protein